LSGRIQRNETNEWAKEDQLLYLCLLGYEQTYHRVFCYPGAVPCTRIWMWKRHMGGEWDRRVISSGIFEVRENQRTECVSVCMCGYFGNTGVLISPLPDQEGNKLQRQKV